MKYTKSLKTSMEFRKTLKRGKYANGPEMVVYSYLLKNKKNNYLGICVSKKNGNSVQRNKMKRWAREAYKETEIILKKGYNIVILYKKNVKMEEIQFNKVKSELIRLVKQLNLIDEE